MTTALTVEQFKQVLPPKMKKSISQELVDQINNTMEHPETMALMRENMLSFTSVMNDGRFKIQQYIAAVKYCSFKFMGDTNLMAYTRAFPEKIAQFTADGVSNKDISSYVNAYKNSKLVMLIMEQSMVPCYVANNHMFQDALNTQHLLMHDPTVSPKVRSDAANSILTHLKPPENKKIEIDIGVNQGSIIEDYQQAMVRMVEKQQELIAAGGDLLQITNASIKKTDSDIVEAEIVPPKKKAIPTVIDDDDVIDTTPLKMIP